MSDSCYVCTKALVNHSRSVIHAEKAEEEIQRRSEQESTRVTQEGMNDVVRFFYKVNSKKYSDSDYN